MKITDISIGTISIPLITPFKTSLRTVDRIRDLIVRVWGFNARFVDLDANLQDHIIGRIL